MSYEQVKPTCRSISIVFETNRRIPQSIARNPQAHKELYKNRIKYKNLLSVGQIASLRSSLPGRHRGCRHVRWM